jgi:endo-1,4-beta-xylanase
MPKFGGSAWIDRRCLLKGLAAGAFVGGHRKWARAATPTSSPADTVGPGIDAQAKRRGLFFGTAIKREYVGDPRYARLVSRECGAITAEAGMQWIALQPDPQTFAFDRTDGVLGFSLANRLWLRGHALLWHEAVPQWFDDGFHTAAEWDRVVAPYIDAVAARYGRNLRHWDVLNEALKPEDGRADGLRSWRLPQVMGEDYVIQAYRRVHEAAPQVKLYYNDYGVEYDDLLSRAYRVNMLRAFERWLKAGVPLHGFGMQSHLETARGAVDANSLRRFLSDVAGMGLDIVISELDVREDRFDEPIARRDQIVADEAQRFLDAALDEPRLRGIVSWGLSDRYSWLLDSHDKRNRGLPYDNELSAKPLRRAIVSAVKNAPERAI